MKGNMKQAVAGLFCGLALLAQAAVSWGVALSTEAQVDFMPKFDLNGNQLTSPTFSSPLGVTFGDFGTSVSGNIYANGTNVNAQVVGPTSQAGAGSFITGTDGSSGLNGSFYQTSTEFAQLNTQVFAAPAAPGSNPADSDFVVLGSTTASSTAGDRVRAADTATYIQAFTIGGTPGQTGTLTVSADYLYNFMLADFNPQTDKALGQGQTIFTMLLGGIATTFDMGLFTATLADMNSTDILNPNGLFSQIFNVNAGDAGIFTATVMSNTEVVPEPGTFVLAAAGLLGLFLFRKKFIKQA